jgi:hypothetical protein
MAKKSVDAALAAYKSKGMKAPRPGAGPALDPSKAPSHKGTPDKNPSYGKVADKEAKMAPEHKKRPLPTQEAPHGVSGPNGGSSYELPKSGRVGESEV